MHYHFHTGSMYANMYFHLCGVEDEVDTISNGLAPDTLNWEMESLNLLIKVHFSTYFSTSLHSTGSTFCLHFFGIFSLPLFF